MSDRIDEATSMHEEALTACVLAGPYDLDEVAAIVSASDFISAEYSQAYSAVLDMHAAGSPLTATAVEAELRARGITTALGGGDFVSNLIKDGRIQKHSVKYHATKVAEAAGNRRFRGLVAAAYERSNAGESFMGILPALEAELSALAAGVAQDAFMSAGDAAALAISEILEARERKTSIGCPTGIPALDADIGGLPKGTLTILAARPSIGKSIIAGEIALRNAEAGRRVMFASLEMSGAEMGQRFLSRATDIPTDYFRNPKDLTSIDLQQLSRAKEQLDSRQLHLWCKPSANMPQLRAAARRQMAKGGLDLLCVDYLGLMDGSGKDTYERVSTISKESKALARELDVPLLMLCQLNRDSEKLKRRPLLSDLRDSGSIEQDADIVMFIIRERDSSDCILNIAKFRNGPLGDVQLNFDGPHCRVSDSVVAQDFEF